MPAVVSRTHPARRVALAAAASALAVAGLGATTAPADAAAKARVKATVKLAGDKSEVLGKVTSPRAECKKKVTVVLYWLEPGKRKFVPVEDDRTNRSGAWKVDAPGTDIPAGKYYVKVAGTPRCQPERSKTIRVR